MLVWKLKIPNGMPKNIGNDTALGCQQFVNDIASIHETPSPYTFRTLIPWPTFVNAAYTGDTGTVFTWYDPTRAPRTLCTTTTTHHTWITYRTQRQNPFRVSVSCMFICAVLVNYLTKQPDPILPNNSITHNGAWPHAHLNTHDEAPVACSTFDGRSM